MANPGGGPITKTKTTTMPKGKSLTIPLTYGNLQTKKERGTGVKSPKNTVCTANTDGKCQKENRSEESLTHEPEKTWPCEEKIKTRREKRILKKNNRMKKRNNKEHENREHKRIKLISWNCRSLTDNKMGKMLDENPDILVLCETRNQCVLRAKALHTSSSLYSAVQLRRKDNVNAGGVAILVKKPLEIKLLQTDLDQIIMARVSSNKVNCTVISAYRNAKVSERKLQNQTLERILTKVTTKYKDLNLILAGDLNMVLPRDLEHSNKTEREFTKFIIETFNVKNVGKIITRPSSGLEIDHILTTNNDEPSSILEGFTSELSDQLPITKMVKILPTKRRYIWRLKADRLDQRVLDACTNKNKKSEIIPNNISNPNRSPLPPNILLNLKNSETRIKAIAYGKTEVKFKLDQILKKAKNATINKPIKEFINESLRGGGLDLKEGIKLVRQITGTERNWAKIKCLETEDGEKIKQTKIIDKVLANYYKNAFNKPNQQIEKYSIDKMSIGTDLEHVRRAAQRLSLIHI